MKNKEALKAISSCNPKGKIIIEIPKGDIQRISCNGCDPVDCDYYEVIDVSQCNEITVLRIGEHIK